MAGRPIGKRHQEDVRLKIQSSQLVNVIQNHALGSEIVDPSRIRAAEILLKKTLPDLQAIQHSGDNQNPVSVKFVWGND